MKRYNFFTITLLAMALFPSGAVHSSWKIEGEIDTSTDRYESFPLDWRPPSNILISDLPTSLISVLMSVSDNHSCTEMANKITNSNGYGTLNNPSKDVFRLSFTPSDNTTTPNFEMIGQNFRRGVQEAHVIGTYMPEVGGRDWYSIAVTKDTEDMSLSANSFIRSGRYQRTYVFTANDEGDCLLRRIHISFTPIANYVTERINLNFERCLSLTLGHLNDWNRTLGESIYYDEPGTLSRREELQGMYGLLCLQFLPYFAMPQTMHISAYNEFDEEAN